MNHIQLISYYNHCFLSQAVLELHSDEDRVTVTCAVGEGDALVIALALKHNAVVLADDSDYLIANVDYVPFREFDVKTGCASAFFP